MAVAFLGPAGTFTEQALRSQEDLLAHQHVAVSTIGDVITAVAEGAVELGFIPIENAIEGPVDVATDALAFGPTLRIQREVVMPIHLDLLVRPDTQLHEIRHVISHPMALAQVRSWLAANLPHATTVAANSTAEAARLVAREKCRLTAAVAPSRAGELYGLVPLAARIEDHEGNATRFLLLGSGSIPVPTADDKTTVVCFQHENRPGSLLEILHELAARGINLTRLVSRPTKQALGDYYFVVEFEGHLDEPRVGDALRAIKIRSSDVRFLGSYAKAT